MARSQESRSISPKEEGGHRESRRGSDTSSEASIKAFWGRGIATDALLTLTAHAFAERGLRRLWANVMGPNTASARVLSKAGYAHEATLRDAIVDRAGGVHDELLFVRFADRARSRP